ncbi:DUF4397 domain-containing protein [Halalkalicoccus sp. NIPERK01]|uniref:DUF4397 domain-containing protein n=1 Tax=Halalkalicoccus sp. NIPERK01 TaxID=3053469 RepID=UPI00256EB222|nr:DUF4397 domain-containing protein [Halalkalicoccus sp. NIPERK01]MDL5360845.1 DUF4397 domain-containing protein [Halalkalicoccus sp. NIPERK01]
MPQRTGISRRRFVQLGGGVAVVGLTGGFASADGHDDQSEGDDSMDDGGETANVRVAHLSPDAPNVDVFVDDEAVLEDVPFTAVSDYLELPAGSYNVKVSPAGEGPEGAVLEEDLDVPAADLTVAAIGEVSGENQPLELAVLEDDNGDPGDAARVRAVHASPDAPAVDVVVAETGDALFEGVEFGDAAYAEVPAGDYRLCVYPAGEREEAVLGADVEAMGGTVASAFAVGYVAPDDAPADEAFEIVLTVDFEGGDGDDSDDH